MEEMARTQKIERKAEVWMLKTAEQLDHAK
jgi:hypothetical protein